MGFQPEKSSSDIRRSKRNEVSFFLLLLLIFLLVFSTDNLHLVAVVTRRKEYAPLTTITQEGLQWDLYSKVNIVLRSTHFKCRMPWIVIGKIKILVHSLVQVFDFQ